MSPAAEVRAGWLATAAAQLGGVLAPSTSTDGLLPDLAVLDGPDFRSREVHPKIADFYTRTAAWRMEAWSEWSPALAPGGAVVTRFFGRRIGQLALPVSPLEVSRGIDSTVQVFRDELGSHLGAAWLRHLRHTNTWVFSGLYRRGLLPGDPQPRVHVAFPLEQGNIQVFLRPEAGPDGRLRLVSGPGPCGSTIGWSAHLCRERDQPRAPAASRSSIVRAVLTAWATHSRTCRPEAPRGI